MSKQRGLPASRPSFAGFTLIELMLAVALIGILLAAIGGVISGPNRQHNLERVLSGQQCIAGYEFVTDANGNRVQVIGANGGGVACTTP